MVCQKSRSVFLIHSMGRKSIISPPVLKTSQLANQSIRPLKVGRLWISLLQNSPTCQRKHKHTSDSSKKKQMSPFVLSRSDQDATRLSRFKQAVLPTVPSGSNADTNC